MRKTKEQEQILSKELKARQSISLHEAMVLLGVSASTARRIFIRMEENGTAIRTHGGILANDSLVNYYVYEQVSECFVQEKEKIGAEALRHIENNDVLFLDSGTTMAQVSFAIANALEAGDLRHLTIFTNSLVNLNILKKWIKINLIGGEYRANREDFCGYTAEETVKMLHFSKCFLGCDGYSIQQGFSATDFQTARLSNFVAKNSDQKIILADASKFSCPSVISFTKDVTVTKVVTTNGISSNIIAHFKKSNIQVITV